MLLSAPGTKPPGTSEMLRVPYKSQFKVRLPACLWAESQVGLGLCRVGKGDRSAGKNPLDVYTMAFEVFSCFSVGGCLLQLTFTQVF